MDAKMSVILNALMDHINIYNHHHLMLLHISHSYIMITHISHFNVILISLRFWVIHLQ